MLYHIQRYKNVQNYTNIYKQVAILPPGALLPSRGNVAPWSQYCPTAQYYPLGAILPLGGIILTYLQMFDYSCTCLYVSVYVSDILVYFQYFCIFVALVPRRRLRINTVSTCFLYPPACFPQLPYLDMFYAYKHGNITLDLHHFSICIFYS